MKKRRPVMLITTLAFVLAFVVFCVSALVEPPMPFLIHGWVNYSNGTAVLNPNVTITNLNTSEEWQAETSPTSNYYQLVLANGTDIIAGEVLQFEVTSPYGWQLNITNYTITADDIANGGLFNFNITLESPEKPAPNITSSAPSSPVTDYNGATRTFNITIDQPVNVSWLINGTLVKDSEKGVTEASYTNTSAVVGMWNVSAVVENANGTDMQTWIWNVMAPPVVVNEFVSDNATEWIELYNKKDYAISLTGWTIEDNTGTSASLDGKIIAANGYLVLTKATDFSFTLNNDDDIIILKNGSLEVDKVAYGTYDDGNVGDNAPAPGAGKSAGRYPNGVDTNNDSADFRVFDVPIPGAPNTILIPPTTPLLIFGWVNYSDGSPVNNPTITITNLNTSEVFAAETNAGSNYYQLVLATGTDVNATEILQFNATSTDGSQSNITNHTVKQDEVNLGGLFNFNITLAPGGVHDINVSTDYMGAVDGIKITRDGKDIVGPDENLTIGETYNIRYKLTNEGDFNETSIAVIVRIATESWNETIGTHTYSLDIGESNTYKDTWDTSGLPPGNYNITVNASIPIDDDWSNNERTRQVTLALPAAPTITDWYNNITKDNSTEITINESECVFFNASADQPIDVWSWFVDDVNQSHNFDNFSYCGWTVNGTYYVRLNATNANGTSNTITWTVTVEDITPPAKVQNLTNSTPTATAVDLWWAANTEPDLVGYKVYQNGSLLGTTANTYYNVTGLLQGTTYEFNVSAYDDNGLEGENATVTVTTATYPAPEITSFAPATTSVSNNESESRIFNITIDQTVNVSWQINGTEVQFNESVTEASYTNTSAVAGYWEVTATASNENGSVTQTWWWTVNDTTPPTVTDWAPTGTGVAITTNITATFGEPMNESTLNDETIIVENSTGSAIAGAVTYDSATRTVTFDPTANLEYNETYNVTITTGVADLAGNNMASEFRWNFTTEAEWMPAADNLGVEDATGRSGSYVTVPVNITNVKNGPVQGIRIRVDYNESVLNLTNISEGNLTLNWTHLQLGEDRHTMTIATSYTGDAIPNGSSGSVVLLNFHVPGSSGDKSPMNLSLIELSNPYGEVGTAPAKNGTFTVSRFGIIAGRITYACNGTGIAGVVVNLTGEGAVINTAVTNDTGYYNFTDIIPGNYSVNASKPGFYDNSTEVTVIAGETTIADMMLWLKGDLNNNCEVADAGDVVLMLRASVGDIPGDMRYDLNGNSIIADAGDVVLILRASVGDIELL